MSENEKDNSKFEFIKEEVVVKKHKKLRKLLFPTITTVGFAVLFGVTAAVTFTIAAPIINKMIHKDGEEVTPVCFPTQYPDDLSGNCNNQVSATGVPTPEPVIVEKSIQADAADYLSMNEDIRNIAFIANKSIVNITSTFSVEDWFGKAVDKKISTTGVIIYNNTKELLVLVSLDRIKDAKSIRVIFSDNASVKAELRDSESELNIALIAIPLEDIPDVYKDDLVPAVLGESYTLSAGSPIIALGSPNGHAGSIDFGIISSKGSTISITDNSLELFNTDIDDNENSDGIIINLDGEVIGIITRTLKEGNNKNLNTVIGINQLKPYLTAMGNIEPRVYFGVKTKELTSSAKKEYKIINGIYVNDVQPKSPAFKAGIQNGDIILQVDDKIITSTSDFFSTISDYQPDKKIEVTILRMNGSKQEKTKLDVTLSEKTE